MRFCCDSSYLTALGKYTSSYSTILVCRADFLMHIKFFGGHNFCNVLFFLMMATQISCSMKSAWHIISVETESQNLPKNLNLSNYYATTHPQRLNLIFHLFSEEIEEKTGYYSINCTQ
jgi:hypothetical protein